MSSHSNNLLQLRIIIGLRLKKLRIDREQTLNQVARTVKMSPESLRKIEEGKIDWRVLTVVRLSRFYKVELKDLFAEEPEKPL